MQESFTSCWLQVCHNLWLISNCHVTKPMRHVAKIHVWHWLTTWSTIIMWLREMCYLCSQRAARNVPVYFREQEEKEERENAKILSLAEQRKAEEEIQKEFQLKQAQRKITKEYAAFNKGALIKMTMIESVITIQKSYFYSYIICSTRDSPKFHFSCYPFWWNSVHYRDMWSIDSFWISIWG